MKTLFVNFAKTLHDLLTSKKVLTAVGAAIAAYETNGDARKAIVGLAIALLLGQGAADFGKVAAIAAAAAPKPDPAPPVTVTATGTSNVVAAKE